MLRSFALTLVVIICFGWSPLRAAAPTPVLLELFTSEGCSSCPPADRLLQELDQSQPIASADLIVLSEHVDYWNSLGWRDPFSSSEFSARQEQYAKRFHIDSVYTPQLVIDGKREFVGNDASKIREAVQLEAETAKQPLGIEQRPSNGKRMLIRLAVNHWSQGLQGRATLYVAVARNQAQSQVSAGENGGRRLTHVAVVRSLQSLGEVPIGPPLIRDVEVPVGDRDRGLVRIVAFLEDTKSGRILGVAQVKP